MKRMLTIMLVPDRASSVRRYRISSRILWILAGCLLILLGLVVTASIHYGTVIDEIVDGKRIERQNRRLALRLKTLQGKLRSLEPAVDRLQRFEDKLRVITRQTGKERRLAIGPYDESRVVHVESGHVIPFVRTIGEHPDLAADQLDTRLSGLDFSIRQREYGILQLDSHLQGQENRLTSTPTIWPCPGWVTSDFGLRKDPYTGYRIMHRGIDIANKPGVPVIAPAGAVVASTTHHERFGKLLELDHGYGIRTRFGHLKEFRVRIGERVDRGDIIGVVGNSGRSTGPHLHYEVEVFGIHENPRSYLLDD